MLSVTAVRGVSYKESIFQVEYYSLEETSPDLEYFIYITRLQ